MMVGAPSHRMDKVALLPRLTGPRAILSIGIIAAIPLLGGSASAAESAATRITDLGYDVYVGGLHVFAFEVEMRLAPDRYRVTAAGETQGMVGWVASWNLNLAAEGFERDGRILPQRYVAQSEWQSRARKTELGFQPDGSYTLTQTPPPEPDPDIEGGLPAMLPQDTMDPLSFALIASRALEKSGRCDQTVPVFDGQRRSDAIVRQVGPEVLPPNDYSIYQGPATRCSLSIKRISGFRKSLRSRGEDVGAPPTLWMASLRPDLPPIPVRYEGEIKLGKIVVHLTRAEFRTDPTP